MHMGYTEPRIVRADDAILAIQSIGQRDTQKPNGPVAESSTPPYWPTTPNAYEADE